MVHWHTIALVSLAVLVAPPSGAITAAERLGVALRGRGESAGSGQVHHSKGASDGFGHRSR